MISFEGNVINYYSIEPDSVKLGHGEQLTVSNTASNSKVLSFKKKVRN